MKFISNVVLSTAAVAVLPLLAITPEAAYAQDNVADERDALEEIVVRARRREESLQTAPVSVAAYTGETIERAGMISVFDIAARTPSVQLNFQSTGEPEVFIRGIGTEIESAGANNAVGFFVDDAHLARGGGSLADMFDVERVEVLRGPQTTYYGKNVSGGAINFITNKPSQDTDARFMVELGNQNHIRTQGMVNGALTDTISGRLAFNSRDRDGWTTNVHTGNRMDDVSVNAFRGSLLFEPSDDVSVRLTAETYQKRGGSIPNKLVYATDPNEQIFITPDPFTQFSSIDGHEPMDSDSYTMKIEWQTGLGLVESLTNYRDTEYDWNQNSTGNLYPEGILYGVIDQVWFNTFGTRCTTPDFGPAQQGGNCWASVNETEDDGRGSIYFEQTSIEAVEQWSQEFRLSSQNDGSFNWFGGVFFANEQVTRQDISKFAIRFGPGTTYNCFPPAIPPCTGVRGSWNEGTENIGGLVDADIFGAFVGVDIDFSDTLSLSISTRYSKDDKTFTSTKSGRVLNACACTTLPDGTETASWHPVPSQEWMDNIGTPEEGTFTPDNTTAAVVPVAFGETDDWDNLSSRISLNWRVSDSIFLYGLISEGYKGGGWEGRAASGQTELIDTKFEEETAINYEVGLKADFWDRRARLNVTGFFTEYDGLQMTILKPVFDPISGTVIDSNAFTTNVGKAQASGFEVEFAFLPFDGMMITGSYGNLSTEIQDDVFLLVDPGDPDDQINDPATVENLNGNELARAPESSYNLAADYTWEMGGGSSASIVVEYNWTEGNWATNRNHLFQPDQNFLDASLNFVSASGQWEVKLWGRNLTDELNLNNLIFSGDTTEDFDTLLIYHDYSDPRTYGVAFTWNYQ